MTEKMGMKGKFVETYFAHGRVSGLGCKIVIRGQKVRNKSVSSEEE